MNFKHHVMQSVIDIVNLCEKKDRIENKIENSTKYKW